MQMKHQLFNLIPDKTHLNSRESNATVGISLKPDCYEYHWITKKNLLVNGKAKKPHWFKNISSLPVTCDNNSKSWMTSLIFFLNGFETGMNN